MENILKRQATRPEKPPKKCSGCGALEGDEPFLACPKCSQLNMISSLFCSQECFAASWKEHKKIHTVEMPTYIEPDASFGELSMDCSLIREAYLKINQKDIVGGKKLLQKAIKRDPSNSHAYTTLGELYWKLGKAEDAIQMFQQCLERSAFAALTGTIGEEQINLLTARMNWARSVEIVLTHYQQAKELSSNKDIKYASWYSQEELLMNVTKSAFDILKVKAYLIDNVLPSQVEDTTREVIQSILTFNKTRILLLARKIIDVSGDLSIEEDLSQHFSELAEYLGDMGPNDLSELAKHFELFAEFSAEEQQKDGMLKTSKVFFEIAKRRKILQDSGVRSYVDLTVPGDLSIGSWVVVKGLQSETDSAMNGKLGYIHTGPIKERFVVEVEGVKGNKSIKGCNLDPVKIDDVNRGIIPCLHKTDQWNFMGDVVKGKFKLKSGWEV